MFCVSLPIASPSSLFCAVASSLFAAVSICAFLPHELNNNDAVNIAPIALLNTNFFVF